MEKVKKLAKYLVREELKMQHRLINIILSVGVVALIVCSFFDFVVGTGARTFWIMILLIVSFILSLYIANGLKKPNLAGIFLAILANYILMPVLFFAEGGKESGMPLWMLLASLFTFLIVEGWPCYIIYAGNVICSVTLLHVDYYHPEIAQRMASRWAEYLDYMYGIAFVTLTFGVIFKFQGGLYEKKREELERTEEELIKINLDLEKANEAKSVFLARMSHEIRTPINAVIGMNEMVLRESSERSIINYANNIEMASNTLLSLVNDILDFSKMESGLMKIIPDDYDVFSLIKSCYTLLDMRAKGKGLKLKLDCNEKLPSVLKGDEMRIRQIVTNLLTNAVKYTDSGMITLEVDFVKKEEPRIDLIIRVIDTGRGISEEGLEGIFESFRRADERQNHSIEGTGLGLAITKQLTDLMGGSISVKSQLGRGSEFTVVIPQEAVSIKPIGDFWQKFSSEPETGENYRESFKAEDARILVVDDVAVNLQIISLLLKKTGVNVDMASSGMECLEKYEKNHYDIVLLDHMMPQMDGIETFVKMQETDRYKKEKTPIIALTANAVEGADKEYLAVGFNDYMTKPVQATELEKMLIRYLPAEKVSVR
ncbi:MAG: response regulator [Lachnospiraceae bacterium]|nr:response regulator [Lachnospiraceae bacterium]